jgi:antitoxin YefM
MDALSYSDFRDRLEAVLARVVADREPVVVTRPNAEAVVVVSLADWTAREATAHLLSTTSNADRLLAAVRDLEAGREA